MGESTGRWVTDAGDYRVASAEKANRFRCWGPPGTGCGELLSVPFFMVNGAHADTLCPACALAHFGVRPPGTETCGECGASPCDCEKPIWSFRVRERGGNRWAVLRCDADGRKSAKSTRPIAVDAWRACTSGGERSGDGYREFGPVQRIADPPFDFDAAAKTRAECDYLHCGEPGGCPTHSPGEPSSRAAPKPSLCHLDWCSAPTHSTFCSTNCERAHEDRIAAVARREAFVARVIERAGGVVLVNGHEEAIGGEIAWAERHTEEAVAEIRARWCAMRTEQPVGDASAFPLLTEETEASW